MINTWGIGDTEAKLKAKQIYSGIGRVACPFFNGEIVIFNRKGFTHLMRRGAKVRPRDQRLIRLRLIEFAEAIVKNQDGNVVIEFRDEFEIERKVNRFGKKVLEKRPAKSWGFITIIEGSEVVLVIEQTDTGDKEFVSIMTEQFELHAEDQR